jgi:hypothetical protein
MPNPGDYTPAGPTISANSRVNVLPYYAGIPALGATTAVHAAVTDTGSPQVLTTAITNPDSARNVTATSGGTGANITAVQVVVTGTNLVGEPITETLPVFTAATPTTVVGLHAFATITSITVPTNGTGVTTAIGTGAKLGLPRKCPFNTVLIVALNNVREATAATVTNDPTYTSLNTVTLNSALNGTAIDVIFVDYHR